MISHDDIANIAGIPCQTFKQKYKEITREFVQTVYQYFTETVRAGSVSGAGTSTGTGNDPSIIKLDPDGWPIAPSPPSWDKFTKDRLETMYRSYMYHHYHKYMFTLCRYFMLILFKRPCIWRERPAGS